MEREDETMDQRIEGYLRDHNFEGELGNAGRGKNLVRVKQFIYYVLLQAINCKSIAQMMDCSQDTVYRGVKHIEKNIDQYVPFTADVKKALIKYGLEFLETGKIPLTMLK